MALETIKRGGWTAKLYQDTDPANPRREWDQLGVMVCWHRRYDLGDRKPTTMEEEALNRGGFRLLDRYLRIAHHAVEVIKLGLIDHSGISMYVGGGAAAGDAQGWDSGTVGFIYLTREDIADGWPTKDEAGKVLAGVVETYDQYLRGDVYGYEIRDEDGEERDSCWGFFGYQCAQDEMADALDRAMGYELREAAKVEAMMHV